MFASMSMSLSVSLYVNCVSLSQCFLLLQDGTNEATGTFTITVVDTTAPVFGTLPDVRANTVTTSAVVTFGPFYAQDTVSGSVLATCTPASGSTFSVGTTTVICSATDGSSNTATTNFHVVVQEIRKLF